MVVINLTVRTGRHCDACACWELQSEQICKCFRLRFLDMEGFRFHMHAIVMSANRNKIYGLFSEVAEAQISFHIGAPVAQI